MDAVLADRIRRSDFTQFREAAALLAAPSQNLVYADTAGNIGYQLPGAVPRRGTRGRAYAALRAGTPATTGAGRSRSPSCPTPTTRRAASSSPPTNQVIGGSIPYPLGSAYSYGWRSQEIVDRLRRRRTADPRPGRAAVLRRHHPGRRRPGAAAAADQGVPTPGWSRASRRWSAGTTPPRRTRPRPRTSTSSCTTS